MAAARCRVGGLDTSISCGVMVTPTRAGDAQVRKKISAVLSINCIKTLDTNNLYLHCFLKMKSTISHLKHGREEVQTSVTFCW